MTVTLDNFTDFRIPLMIGNHAVNFFVFNEEPMDLARSKINSMRQVFERMPSVHLPGVGPIFLLIGRPLPDAEHHSGGGTYPDVRRLHAARGGENDRRTADWGVSYEVIAEAVRRFGRFGGGDLGIHVIPRADWQQTGYTSTVVHEAAHGIDTFFNLHRRPGHMVLGPLGANLPMDAFPLGLANQFCGHGHGDNLNRRAVNAYCSMITGFRGVAFQHQCEIMAAFQASNAFNAVPESWWTTQFPDLSPSNRHLH